MVSLYTKNQPTSGSSLQSSVIRDNFEALYNKVGTLEVRADSPATTFITLQGGPIYFRDSKVNSLKLVNFQTKRVDIQKLIGYKTKKILGVLSRELQSFSGPSEFQSEGLNLEVLITVNYLGEVIFTEALAGQNNELSSPFNIYFDDYEIPAALLLLKKNSNGVLQVIEQAQIYDARPSISSALQNNPTTADVETTIDNHEQRIVILESNSKVTSNGLVKLPSETKLLEEGTIVDGVNSNTKIEVISASGIQDSHSGQILRFAGGMVDFKVGATSNLDSRVFSAGTTAALANNYIRAAICLIHDPSSVDPVENSTIKILHGTAAPSLDAPYLTNTPTIPDGYIPLAKILYKMDGYGTNIYPLTNMDTIDEQRINYKFPIINMTEVDGVVKEFAADWSTENLDPFAVSDYIEIEDDNTRPIRRKINYLASEDGYSSISILDSFVDISIDRHPYVTKISSGTCIPLIEDVRPFIGK